MASLFVSCLLMDCEQFYLSSYILRRYSSNSEKPFATQLRIFFCMILLFIPIWVRYLKEALFKTSGVIYYFSKLLKRITEDRNQSLKMHKLKPLPELDNGPRMEGFVNENGQRLIVHLQFNYNQLKNTLFKF